MDARELFEVPEGIYLLNHSVGALPRAARGAVERHFEAWKSDGGDAWGAWLGQIEGFRGALATLFGGKAAEYCPQPGVTAGVVKLLHSVSPRPGRGRILLSRLDFPSVGFAIQQLRRRGWTVDFLEPDARGFFPLERWDAALTPETDWVLITHSIYGNSWLNPVAEIAALARARGVFTIVDIAQSAGVVPIRIEDWNPDAVTGSCVKWLCGGPGAGFLWTNPARVSEFAPEDVGWFSHENPFEFRIDDFRYAPDGRRFWGGTPSVLAYAVASESIKQLTALGIDAIRRHNQALTSQLLSFADSHGIPSPAPRDPAQRGGTAVLALPDPPGAVARLRAAGVRVDSRPGFGVRFSPHIFNTAAEIERVCGLLG